MSHTSTRTIRALSFIAGSVLLIAACGGGSSSSGRQRNAALCYADQAEKDAAVLAAQDAFDASFGGNPPPSDSVAPTDSVAPSSNGDTPDTTVPADESSDTTTADGGGYRRPAVRHFATVPPTQPGDSVPMTDEQLALQLAMQAAEQQPLCESSDTTTASDASVEHNCAFEFSLNASNEPIGNLIQDQSTNCGIDGFNAPPVDENHQTSIEAAANGVTVATFTLDFTGQNSIIKTFSYTDPSNEGSSDSTIASDTTVPGDTVQCSVQMNSTGSVTTCSKAVTTLFSEPGQIPLVSDGNAEFTAIGNSGYSVTVSFGEVVYFYMNCVTCSSQTFTFEVPSSLEDSASNPGGEPDLLPLTHGATFTADSQFDFTLTEDSQVSITVNGQACDGPHSDPELWIYGGHTPWDQITNDNLVYYDNDSFGSDDNCQAAFFNGDLPAGDYFLWVSGGGSLPVTVNSSVQLDMYEEPPFVLPETAFSYSYKTASAIYTFSLTETSEVLITAGNGETCSPEEVDVEGDGIASPEVQVFTAKQYAASADLAEPVENGHGEPRYGTPDNCAVSVVTTILNAGDYVVQSYVDDGDTGNITIGSNIELTSMRAPSDIKFDHMTTQQIDAVKSYDIVVPAGGAWFRAEGNSHQAKYGVDPLLILVDSDNNTIAVDDDGGDTITNYVSSLLELHLNEGTYRLIATTYNIFWDDCTDCETNYELRYGFGAAASKPQPEVVVTPSSNNQMPTDIPETPKLPVASLVQDSANGIVPALLDGVTSMVCNSTCIDTLFTNAGITDGSIDITIGDSTVTVKKGQKKAVIKVGARASKISVTATSADGTQKVDLSTPVASVPAAVQQAVEAGQTIGVSSNSSGLTSKLPYLLALLVVLLGAAAVLNTRRKKSVTQG